MKIKVGEIQYDTGADNFIAITLVGNHRRDPDYYLEVLYRTNCGCWYIYGLGGRESKYNQHKIIPLQNDEAYRWLVECGEHQRIMEYFYSEKRGMLC